MMLHEQGRSQNEYSVELKELEFVFSGFKIIRIYIQWGQNYKSYKNYDKLLIFVGSKLYL